ncbi:response regulator transcription factor [Streptomyces mirabilis]|uniref:response regulator transcription factor n=1 Tax=Streptomyces mirabilis TaxID=68239 RepID=UPI0036742B21
MRVAIAEDDAVYRAGLVELLTAANVEVVYQAINGQELLKFLTMEMPDAVLMDIQMGGRSDDGMVTAEIISERHPDLGIVLLSHYENSEFVNRFFAHGTSGRGYLLKDRFNDVEDVRNALDLVRRRKTYSDTSILDSLHHREPTIKELLSPREISVLRFLAAGRSNLAIAQQLHITPASVENVNQNIYRKLDIPKTKYDTPRVHATLRWLQEKP